MYNRSGRLSAFKKLYNKKVRYEKKIKKRIESTLELLAVARVRTLGTDTWRNRKSDLWTDVDNCINTFVGTLPD